MRDFSIQEQAEATSAKDVAQLRWKAVEAFNTHPNLSPMARRVGIALITMMDAKTRACFPSQQRIADTLMASVASVKRAKKELQDANLLHWTNPGGPRHLSRYMFNWQKLIRLSAGMRDHVSAQAATRRSARNRGPETPSWAEDETSTPDNVIRLRAEPNGYENEPNEKPGLGSSPDRIGLNSDSQRLSLVPSIGSALSPELSHELAESELPSSHHDKTEGVKPLLQVARPKKRSCPFPSLLRQWEGNEEMLALIERLSFDDLGIASAILASPKKGALEAEAFIRGNPRNSA